MPKHLSGAALCVALMSACVPPAAAEVQSQWVGTLTACSVLENGHIGCVETDREYAGEEACREDADPWRARTRKRIAVEMDKIGREGHPFTVKVTCKLAGQKV